ncbi:hypothetical protein P692DRAFT_201934114 [Suillus brevipes Sb2]|nr:hypothetical protein P692DRAFT_201934114 [Suillus brevipes Sb2]
MSTSYLQMTQSTSNASSSHGSGSSNATRNMPNTGMHMVPFPWSQPPHIPDPGYVPVHPYFPYGVPFNATYGATPSYAPLAPSFGVGAGVPDHAFQAGLDGHLPPPVADVSGGNPLSQASGSSVGEKRAAEDLEERDAKRTKTTFSKMSEDPLFKPVLNQFGQPNGKYVCSKDGMVLRPESYRRHIKTKQHVGHKLARFKCPICSRTFSRGDSYKRHYTGRLCERLAAGRPEISFLTSEASASDAPATVPEVPFTYAPNPMFAASMPAVVDPKLGPSQPSETGVVAEPAAADEDDPEFWEDLYFLGGWELKRASATMRTKGMTLIFERPMRQRTSTTRCSHSYFCFTYFL